MYPYTADLLCLSFNRPLHQDCWTAIMGVVSPLKFKAWEAALCLHPDKAFGRLLTEGLREGFRIGFDRRRPLKPALQNMQSAHDHPEAIDDYLAKECSLGRMLGPFTMDDLAALPQYQINRFGVIPKGHGTGKWRLITDLSFPPERSVNDGIDPVLCSLSYPLVEQVSEIAARLGRGALLAKMDIESAYRLIPVHPQDRPLHPQDRPLQAMQWRERVYIDPMLPFGLRSAPKLFNAVADALE